MCQQPERQGCLSVWLLRHGVTGRRNSDQKKPHDATCARHSRARAPHTYPLHRQRMSKLGNAEREECAKIAAGRCSDWWGGRRHKTPAETRSDTSGRLSPVPFRGRPAVPLPRLGRRCLQVQVSQSQARRCSFQKLHTQFRNSLKVFLQQSLSTRTSEKAPLNKLDRASSSTLG